MNLLIILQDVNDNLPIFPEGSLRETYNIKEDAEVHTLLTKVTAIDPDLGKVKAGTKMFFAFQTGEK